MLDMRNTNSLPKARATLAATLRALAAEVERDEPTPPEVALPATPLPVAVDVAGTVANEIAACDAVARNERKEIAIRALVEALSQ